jgi:two-component system C4-dicarboxylate transport sensor histidine kinase DctB
MTRRYWIVAATIFGVIVVAAGVLGLIMYDRALGDLDKSSQESLSLLSDGLHTSIDRYEPIPVLIGDSDPIRKLVDNPKDHSSVDAANRFLEAKVGTVGAAYIYVLDPDGRTIAASNWAAPDSFVGNDYSIRPYYRDAKATCRGAYYGIGVTTRQPGYFLASCIRTGDRLVGIAVVKIDLRPFETSWQKAGEQVIVLDEDGIAFLASDPAWRYRPLHPLDPKRLQEIIKEEPQSDPSGLAFHAPRGRNGLEHRAFCIGRIGVAPSCLRFRAGNARWARDRAGRDGHRDARRQASRGAKRQAGAGGARRRADAGAATGPR